MKYFLTKDYLYIEERGVIRGIPLKHLSNDELGEKIRELVSTGAEYNEKLHLTLKVKK
jgi:hypothetical protein